MNLDKWQDIRANVLDNFEVLERREETDEDGHGKKEIIEFLGPLGKTKLEFCVRDAVLDKKTNFSNRVGSGISVEYTYSDTEKDCFLNVYQYKDDDWEEIDSSMF